MTDTTTPEGPVLTAIDGRYPRRDERVRLRIERMSDDGLGVGWLEGELRGVEGPIRAEITVREALPGDEVIAHITSRRRGVSAARIDSFVAPSPLRVTPRCPYAEIAPMSDGAGASCGGCTLQGLDYGAQLTEKEARVRRHMVEAGHEEIVVLPTLGAESRFGHRHKMEFSFGRGPEGELVAGLHPRGYRWEVLDLTSCAMISDAGFDLVLTLKAAARALGLEARDERRERGWLETLTLRESRRHMEGDGPARLFELTTHDADTVETTLGPLPAREVAARLSAELSDAPGVVGFVWTRRSAGRGRPTTRHPEVITGQGWLPEVLRLPDGRDLSVHVSHGAFFQPHPRQAERLLAVIAERLGDLLGSSARVADLYCGTGVLGLAIAHLVREVIGVELVPEAVEDAEANAARSGISNASFIAGDVGKVLADPELGPRLIGVDAAILDPPRAGLMPQALQHIATLGARRLVYVSCNPAALARDIGPLAELGYALAGPLQPVDLFPHTHHVETVALFEKAPKA